VTVAARLRLVLLLAAAALVSGVAVRLFRADQTGVLPEPIAASYPEGPLADGDRLYFAEMGADRVSVVEAGAATVFFDQHGCGPTAIAPYGTDGYLVLCHLGRRVVSISAAGEELGRWTADVEGNPLMDPNDASTDGRGGVYFSDPGVFSKSTDPHGRILHLTDDGLPLVVADGLWYPNGVYVDQRRRQLYVSEHLAQRVVRFEIRPDGGLGPPATVARLADAPRSERYDTPFDEVGFDGLEMGPSGDLYVAVYGEGRVLRFAPSGTYLGAMQLPTRYATNIAFLADGTAVTTGSFTNAPPLGGEVRFHESEAVEAM
jgi:gluconolactonase